MRVVVKYIKDDSGNLKAHAVSKETGISQGEINPDVIVSEGEEIDILFKCAYKEKCGYPFCGFYCGGNSGFYVAGIEEISY